MSDDQNLESAVLRAAGPLAFDLLVSVPLLFLPRQADRTFELLVHLVGLVAFSYALA